MSSTLIIAVTHNRGGQFLNFKQKLEESSSLSDVSIHVPDVKVSLTSKGIEACHYAVQFVDECIRNNTQNEVTHITLVVDFNLGFSNTSLSPLKYLLAALNYYFGADMNLLISKELADEINHSLTSTQLENYLPSNFREAKSATSAPINLEIVTTGGGGNFDPKLTEKEKELQHSQLFENINPTDAEKKFSATPLSPKTYMQVLLGIRNLYSKKNLNLKDSALNRGTSANEPSAAIPSLTSSDDMSRAQSASPNLQRSSQFFQPVSNKVNDDNDSKTDYNKKPKTNY